MKFRMWNGFRMMSYEDLKEVSEDIWAKSGYGDQYDGGIFTTENPDHKLMVCSELKDSMGNDIYQGDYIKFLFDGEVKIAVVEFSIVDGMTCSFTSFNQRYNMKLSKLLEPDRETEVIANLYTV